METNCYNSLTLNGNSETLQNFHLENHSSEEGCIDFAKAVPFPKDWDETEKNDKNIRNNWSIINWGTKINCYDGNTVLNWQDADENKAVLSPIILELSVYRFTTILTPPVQWLIKTAKLYPDLQFELKYGQPYIEYSGILTIQNEEIILEEEGDYGEYFDGNDSDSDNEPLYL